MKKNVKRSTVISLVFIVLFIFCSTFYNGNATNITMVKQIQMNGDKLLNTRIVDTTKQNIDTTKIFKLRLNLIREVDNFIRNDFPTAPHRIAELLVDNGLNHDLDICFMMTQTQLETGYGTAGIGRNSSRKSLFGVMKRKYSTYDDATNDYCNLLKKSYLGNKRTTNDLMQNYVTLSGYRYCVKRDYESKFRKQYNVIRKTNIYDLQNQIRKLS